MQDGVDEEPRLDLMSAGRLLVGRDNDLAEAIQCLVFSSCEEALLIPSQVNHRAGLVPMLRRSLRTRNGAGGKNSENVASLHTANARSVSSFLRSALGREPP